VKIYTGDGSKCKAGERPDALSLMDKQGANTNEDEEYWVRVQLLGQDNSCIWIERHNVEGLRKSDDGQVWTRIATLDQIGVEELDAELHLLMPARLGHLRFGKDATVVHVLSQVVGLDDLALIAEVAGKLAAALRTEATQLEKGALQQQKNKTEEHIKLLTEKANDAVKGMTHYEEIIGAKRSLEAVKEFGVGVARAISEGNKKLAADLGITPPQEGTTEAKAFEQKLKDLHGQVRNALDELARPLSEIFKSSLGFALPTSEELNELVRQLDTFEQTAKEKVVARLAWAREERKTEKAGLMLLAAAYFSRTSQKCPVCTQDLEPVPHIQKELERLSEHAHEDHLRKTVEDLERSLIDDLGKIVDISRRNESPQTLVARVLSDWQALKKARFGGLLLPIAERFDQRILELALGCEEQKRKQVILADGFFGEFPDVFSNLDTALADAWAYISLCQCILKNKGQISGQLNALLLAQGRHEESLSEVITKGKTLSDDLKVLEEVRGIARDLWQSVKAEVDHQNTVAEDRSLAEAMGEIKGLREGVQAEVIRAVQQVESEMKAYFNLLYDREVLELDCFTTGHPGNQHIRDEVNLYLRAGNQRIPFGPFCNAGRMRALTLAFVFALLKKSSGTLTTLVLDDPAMSLDDEHKTRLVDRVISPLLGDKQIILATHYERFYKRAQDTFADAERLTMTPRREASQTVGFEPGDLLQRVEEALSQPSCCWRDGAWNLRRWIERTLNTLSSYCPVPFALYENDLPACIREYAAITDPRIATQRRSAVLSILTEEFVRRVHEMPHDEDVSEPDVRDALDKLKKCRKHSDAEIKHLKQLYHHERLGRAIDARPSYEPLSLSHGLHKTSLRIVRSAAAAESGEGIEWDEHDVAILNEAPVVILKVDTLAPIGFAGQYLVLDPHNKPPENSDLVVVRSGTGETYARRIWFEEDARIVLEAANITSPHRPVCLAEGSHRIQRIAGVLFGQVPVKIGAEGDEWVRGELDTTWFTDMVGIRVRGSSMEPVARDGQIVLVQKGALAQNRDLACVDTTDRGTLIKRCYLSGRDWILCSVNLNEMQDAVYLRADQIRAAYPLSGVLLEPDLIGMY
jgi:SOS-response transcriptional repressor LexA